MERVREMGQQRAVRGGKKGFVVRTAAGSGGYDSTDGAVCLSIAACVLFLDEAQAYLKYAYPGGCKRFSGSEYRDTNPYLGHRFHEMPPCLGREGSFSIGVHIVKNKNQS